MDNMKICWASVNVYDREETVPKRLAEENNTISNDGAIVGEMPGKFCLTPGKELYDKVLWYQKDEQWIRAEQVGKMWGIPGEAMSCHTICRMAFCAAKVKIAFTEKGESPSEDQERILVFHFIKERKERSDAEE